MADNQIILPYLTPVNFYEMEAENVPQYISRFMDDYLFSARIRDYETPVVYTQKWQTSDNIPLQFQSNFDPIAWDVVDCNMNVIFSGIFSKVRANKFMSGFYIHQATINWNTIGTGLFWIRLNLAGQKFMISEPQAIATVWPGTQYYEFKNSTFHGEIIFEYGFGLNFRCESIITNFDPGAQRTVYTDQKLNPTILNAIPYRSWDLVIGKDYGVPDWVADKINWIFSCDNVSIDGKPYAVSQDSKLTAGDIDNVYPMKHYVLKIQAGFNRTSKTVGVNVDANNRDLYAIWVDSTIIADTANTGSDVIQIEDYPD